MSNACHNASADAFDAAGHAEPHAEAEGNTRAGHVDSDAVPGHASSTAEPALCPSGVSDQRAELYGEIAEHFGTLRSALQRWHEAFRRVHGGPASDPSRGQGRALALLNIQGEMRQRDMGFILNIRPQSLGEVLAKLERAGLITRRTSEKDRRVLLVSITDKGRDCVRCIRPPFPEVDLTDDELEQFSHALSQFINAFERDAQRLNRVDQQ